MCSTWAAWGSPPCSSDQQASWWHDKCRSQMIAAHTSAMFSSMPDLMLPNWGHALGQRTSSLWSAKQKVDVSLSNIISKWRKVSIHVQAMFSKHHLVSLGSVQTSVSPTLHPPSPPTVYQLSWLATSYCSLKPLWSGMGEVVPAHTSLTLHPPSLPLCINCRN